MTWKKFEENVYDFIKSNLDFNNIHIVHMGNSNSTVSDIDFYHKSNKIFTIECKQAHSQASQFVVKKDEVNKKFFWSQSNKSPKDSAAEKIINSMNNDFEYYSQVNKDDKLDVDLICGRSLMFERVISQIKSKASFIASSNHMTNFSKENPLLICKIDDIPENFDITGKYRVKKSGSSELPKKERFKYNKKYKDKILEVDGKIYILDPKKEYTPEKEGEYFSKELDDKGYREIRKLSKTKNANVIFSLNLKKHIQHTNLEFLKNYLNSYK